MSTKKKYFYSSLLLLFVAMGLFVFFLEPTHPDSGALKVALRNVGHELLLQSKDSTSLVQPVVKTAPLHYQLSFQSPLSIEPTGLEKTVKSSLEKTTITNFYRVEVLDCETEEVAYSYEFKETVGKSIIPCGGRTLPKACYVIHFTFIAHEPSMLPPYMAGFGFLIIIAVGTEYLLSRKKSQPELFEVQTNPDYKAMGCFKFYPKQNKLMLEGDEIALSKKECELLLLFIEQTNQVITREELTKRIWEDNGVFVGRSLDTYISKLRKKVQLDSNIKLTNVHGVGYKLEIET